jgi:hypothetical protein
MYSTYFSLGLANSDGVPLPLDDISLMMFTAKLGTLGHTIVAQTTGEGIYEGQREPCAVLIVSSDRPLDNDPEVLALVRRFLCWTRQDCAVVVSAPARFVYADSRDVP